jgi:hypothetical protein
VGPKVIHPMDQAERLYTAIVRVLEPKYQKEFSDHMRLALMTHPHSPAEVCGMLLEAGSLLYNYPHAYFEAKAIALKEGGEEDGGATGDPADS